MHVWHRWETVKDTGVWEYRQCRVCGKRAVQQRARGYQPVDRGWLATGQWTPHGPPPRPVGGGPAGER